jgi:predicted GNAT family acetyltransferase
MSDNPNVTVTRNDGAERYDLAVNDVVAGFAAFQESETHIAFTHTEVDDAYRGQGLASQLAAQSLADAVARDRIIIPLCPYMERYLKRHHMEGARVEWPNRAPRQ